MSNGRCWIKEKHRLDEDKEMVLMLLKQVLGVGVVGDLIETALQLYMYWRSTAMMAFTKRNGYLVSNVVQKSHE